MASEKKMSLSSNSPNFFAVTGCRCRKSMRTIWTKARISRKTSATRRFSSFYPQIALAKVSLPDGVDVLPIGDVGQVDGYLYDVLRAGTSRFQAGVHVGNGKLKLLNDIVWDAAVRSDPDGPGYPDQITCFGNVTIVADQRVRRASERE